MDDAGDQDLKTEWAEERTDWAEDRTVLANERTFAGWMRTGLAAIAVALGLKALFQSFEPTWVPKVVAEGFILAALFVFVSAWQAARRTSARVQTHAAKNQSPYRMSVMTALLVVVATATGVILWLL